MKRKEPGSAMNNYNILPGGKMQPRESINISNSVVMEEVARITHGFRPDFAKETPIVTSKPLRTMKTKKFKKSKNKTKSKRVLKRVYHEGTSAMSSWSSLVSSYVDIDNEKDLEPELASHLDINLEYLPQNPENGDMHMIEEVEEGDNAALNGEVSSSPHSSFSPNNKSSSSLPADEYYDSQANLRLERNSPRESFKVFNQ